MRRDFSERRGDFREDRKDDRRKMIVRKKTCRFCADPKMILDYKEPRSLSPFTTEKGKMIPRRVTGNCAFHQRQVGEAVKRARILALLPSGGAYFPPSAGNL